MSCVLQSRPSQNDSQSPENTTLLTSLQSASDPAKMSSTVSASCQTDDCPLRGAAYASITHFDSEITTLTLEKEFFEEGGQGIVEYSDVLTKVNDRRGVFVTEKMVNHLYTTEVLELWDFGAPMAETLLGQVKFRVSKILNA